MNTTTATVTQVKRKSLNMVVIGLPGSGKGTQSKQLAEKYQLAHVSSGELLRSEMTKNTERAREIRVNMEKGTLFPDELVNSVLMDSVPSDNFILDGYPRKLSQTGVFGSVNIVFFIGLDGREAVRRILSRDEGRKDDTEEAVQKRLQAFEKETRPVVDHYRGLGLLHEVDGSGSREEVFERMVGEVEAFLNE